MADAMGTGGELAADLNVLSVAELNGRIEEALAAAPTLDGVACRGEVSDLYVGERSVFFDLTDSELTEQVKCFMFRWRYDRLDVDLEDGVEVLVTDGTVDYYTEGGRLNLKPGDVVRVGEGSRQAHIEMLTADLSDRGWFDAERKQSIPKYPTCVGVVTSRNGDARHDIQDEIQTRHSGIDILLHHARVQGEDAPGDLATGLTALGGESEVDVVIVGRGGGSETDLMAFNTEVVAEALFHVETPTVSAVGHREDETIACRVADTAVNTPTAAGGLFREKRAALADINEQAADLESAYADLVEPRLDRYETAVEAAYTDRVEESLEARSVALEAAYTGVVEARLDRLEGRISEAYQGHEREAAVEEATRTVPLAYKVALAALVILVVALLLLVIL